MQTQEQFVASGGMQSKSLIPMKILIVNQTISALLLGSDTHWHGGWEG